MRVNTSKSLFVLAAAFALFVGMPPWDAYGQEKQEKHEKADKSVYKVKNKEFCANYGDSRGDKVGFREVREFTLASTGSVSVDGAKNGGVSVRGENRSDVAVRACVNAWGTSEESAKSIAENIKISTSGTIRAENAVDDSNWGVSFEVLVPRNTNLDLKAHNGGISIKSVEGTLAFETMNGGVSLYDVAGDVRGRTTNGGVNVKLSGSTWRGAGLDVATTNGGVNLTMPENYAANIETGTVNGGFKSDIPALNVTTEDVKGDWPDRSRTKRINTSINGGGAPIRVITTNGGIKIGSEAKVVDY